MAWREDRIHHWLAAQTAPRGLSGSRGHDAAVLFPLRGRPVMCVDQTIEGVHFESGADPVRVGRKAAARAISDLAATAARPRAVFVALSVPRVRSEAWIRALLDGVRARARAHGADLCGGDLALARGPAHVAVTALGEYVGRGRPPGRDRARRGELVVVTGAVGGSLRGRHLDFTPRVQLGKRLHRSGVRAMMDVSDGLAWDLHRMARASDVRIDVDLARVPVHRDARARARSSGRTALWHALHDGEDHELVATMSRAVLARVARSVRGLSVIGRVQTGRGLHLVDARGRSRVWRPSEGAYEHGR